MTRHALLVSTCVAAALGTAPAHAAKVRVRGKAFLEARLVPTTNGVEVRGLASDDAGAPLGGATVFVGTSAAPLARPVDRKSVV